MGDVHILPQRGFAPKSLGACDTCTARSLTICAPLTPEEQARMGALTSVMLLKPRQVLFREGDDADFVYNITCGSVSLSKSMPDGRRQITGFLSAGDFIGLNTRNTYTATAEILADARLCRFPRKTFQRLLAEMPALEQRLLAITEAELAAAHEQILLLGRKSAMERIATFLLLQSERAQARGLVANPISLPMTRAEAADYLGLTIETVSRCFTKLRNLDVISLPSADRVLVKQFDRLKALAEAA
jgi:CRP/FNR family transcriptional regulator, anaerobic regulatory protein